MKRKNNFNLPAAVLFFLCGLYFCSCGGNENDVSECSCVFGSSSSKCIELCMVEKINNASESELITELKLDKRTAEAIISLRNESTKFESYSDFKKVLPPEAFRNLTDKVENINKETFERLKLPKQKFEGENLQGSFNLDDLKNTDRMTLIKDLGISEKTAEKVETIIKEENNISLEILEHRLDDAAYKELHKALELKPDSF